MPTAIAVRVPKLALLGQRRPQPVDIATAAAYLRRAEATGARGGIGRRARFRSVFRKEWWFDSTRAHHLPFSSRYFYGFRAGGPTGRKRWANYVPVIFAI